MNKLISEEIENGSHEKRIVICLYLGMRIELDEILKINNIYIPDGLSEDNDLDFEEPD